jgi:small subunit ribosomal protein S20
LATQKKKLSVLKRVRQSEKRRLRNRAVTSGIRTSMKKVVTAVDSRDKDLSMASLKDAIGAISSACLKGVLHKNTASRSISRLTKRVNALLKSEVA